MTEPNNDKRQENIASITLDREWWRGAVIYQIYPRSFQDSNGDGVGDLAGIVERLDYVAELGVDAIWLSPFFQSPMKDFGYDVSDYRAVDPLFGNLADFDRVVKKAHGLGIKIIVDQVVSHTSDRHAWFKASRADKTNAKSDWYVWADAKPDGSPPNNWLSMFGGSAWAWDETRQQFYLHNFLTSQPDLNFHAPAVQDAILADMRFWLEHGVDGFRLDTVNYYFHSQSLQSNPLLPADQINSAIAPEVNLYNQQDHLFDKSQPENLEFLEKLRDLLDQFPNKTSVGEIGEAQHQLELMEAYTAGETRLHMAYTFDFLGGGFTATHFRRAIDQANRIAPDSWQCLAFSNHDVVRHASRWKPQGDQPAFLQLCAMLLLSMRGSVCIYQGDELGLTEADLAFEDLTDPYGIEYWPEFKGRDGCRTPMVWQADAHMAGFSDAEKTWLPVASEHLLLAVDQQDIGAGPSILSFYKKFLSFRKTQPALKYGNIQTHDSPENVLAFTREYEGQRSICLFNMGETPAEFCSPEDCQITDVGAPGSTKQNAHQNIQLPPFGAFLGAIKN